MASPRKGFLFLAYLYAPTFLYSGKFAGYCPINGLKTSRQTGLPADL